MGVSKLCCCGGRGEPDQRNADKPPRKPPQDKKKPGSGKSLKAPTGSNGSLADPARSGSSTPVCRSKEPSPALSERAGLLGNKAAAGYGPRKSDILPEGLFYPKDEKRPSMVFENKSATQSLNSLNSEREGYPVYEKLKPDYELEKLNAKPADGRNEGSSPFQSPEDEISPTTVSLVQNAPKFDSVYNQSFSKTPVSDDVMSPDPDDFPLLRQADSKSLLVDRMSQVDTKINTFEEAEPASHEMLTTDDLIPDMTTSVSSKSLQSATIRYPPPPRSKPVSTSGVDNSIDELEDSGEAFEMIIPDTHNALYARSSSRTSLEEKKQMYMPKSEPQETDESTDNMVTTLDDSAVSDSLIDPDEAEPLSSSRPKDDPKRIYQPKSQTPQENDESMDNSVPTLEDQPVLEISLDEEPSEAFVPKGEVRQPKIKDPTASTEKGVDSAVSPRATEEIVPVNASKTQTQPERESSPQNDADPSVDNSVSTLDDKPVSEMSLDDLLAGAYISSRDREGRELRAPPAQSRSRSSLNKEDDDLLSVDVEQIMPIQATESQAAPRDLSIDNAKPTLDDKPDSEMLNQQQPTGTHMSQPGSEGRQMKPPHSQDDEQSGEDNSRRLPEDTAGTKPAKMTHADITPDSLDASVDNSVSTLNDKPITEISLDDQPAGEFMTSLAGKGREMRAPHKRQSASQVPENLAAPGDLNVMDNSVPTHDEMPVSGILMGEEPAGERVSLRSGKGQVMNPSQSQTGEQGRRDNSDKVPITSEEISPTEAGQVQTVPDSLYTSMDNSVSTLNDKPNSEMSLDDQSAGGYMSSRGGEGRELRAPPTKTRVQSSPLNNDEDGSMPEDDEQISPEQPLQSSTNPAYQDGSVDNSISTMGEKPGMEILMADQPIGSDVSSDGKSGELKLPGKKDGSNLPHGNTEAKSSTEPHKGDDLITPLRAEVTRREPGDGQEQTNPDISENIVNSLDDNPVFEVPVDAQPLETRIKRDKGKGKELQPPSKYPDDKSEAAKSNNEEATPDTNQAEPEEIKEKTTTTNLKEKPSSLRSKLFSKSKKKPKEKESKPEKSKKSKEKTKGSKSKNKNKKGEKGAPAVEDITTADMADPVKDQDKKADPSTNQPDGAALTDSNPNNRSVPESQDATVSTLTALEPDTQLLTPDDLVPNSAKLDKSKKLSAPPSKLGKPSTTSTLPPDSDKTDAAAKPDKDHQIEEPRLDKSDLPMSETTSGIKRFEPDSLDENDNKPSELGSASATPNSSFSVISPSKTTISEGSPHDLAMMKGFKPISTDNQEQTLSDDSVSVDKNDSLHAMHSSEYIRKMKLQRELSPDSLTFNVSIDSLNKLSSNERSEMKFELGRDKRLSSSRHGSDSTPSPLPDGCTSPMHKSDIFINIDHPPKTEISAFSSPSRVYKELTPEPSTHILHFTQDATPVDGKQEKDSSHFNRSELRMSVGDHQVPKMGPEFEITFNAPTDTDITLDDTDVVFGDDTMDVREPVSEGDVVPNYSSREKSQPRATPKTETVCVDIELSEPSSDKSITLDSAADTTQYMDLPSDLKTTTELTFDPMSSGKSATQLEGKPTEQQAKTPDKHRDLEPMAQSQAQYEPSPDIPDGLTSHETISNAAPSKLGETGPELGLGSGRPAGQLAREPAEEKSNIPDNVSDSDPVTHSQPDTKQANDDTAPDDIKGTTAPAVSTEENTKTSFDPLSADRHAAQQKSNTSDIDSANEPSALSQTDAEPSTNNQPDSENISPVAVLSAEPAVSVDADETSKKVNSEPDFSGVPAKQSSTQRPSDGMETSEPISSTPATDVIEPVTRSQLNTEPSSDKQTENVPSNDNEVSIKPAVSLELNSNPHPAPVSLPDPQGYEPIKSDTDDRLPDSPDRDSTSDPRAEDTTDPKEASESNSSPDTEMGLYPVGAPADDMTVDLLDPSPPSAADETGSVSSEGQEYSRTETAETEEMIETSVEETVTMVITGVVANPGADEDEEEIVLSMQDAVSQGILDLQNGTFFNSTTRESISFIEAMNSGYIKMGPKKVEKTEEQVKSVGIISIKTVRETNPYTIKGAVDTRDGQMYHVFQATRRKILDSTKGSFTDLKSGNRMLIGDAVDRGLVQIEYDMNASGTIQEEITRTYSVHAVVDQREKVKLPFHEAVSRGLIDPDKGDYIHNITGIHVPVVEAIKKGFIKATETDKPENISVDSMGNKVAEKGVAAIRKKLINPLKVLKGMKH